MAIMGKIGVHRRIGNGYKRFAKCESIENDGTMLRWREYYEKSSSGDRKESDMYSIDDTDNGRDMQRDLYCSYTMTWINNPKIDAPRLIMRRRICRIIDLSY